MNIDADDDIKSNPTEENDIGSPDGDKKDKKKQS